MSNQNKHGAAAAIDIDALLQNTWLQVISLRHGPQFQEGEGRALWDRCVADVERVQQALKAAMLDAENCRHILTAQCALLDEAVKGRGVQDDACVQWYDIPLQGHFLGTMDGHTEIYAVDSVVSSRQHTYMPFSSFRHKGGMMRHQAPEYYYHTRVRRGPSGLHNTWLILGGEAFDNHTVPADESLSLTLTGTNGQLPRRALQSTVLDTVMKTTSASIAVRNLCAPTLPCYPPAQDRFHWRVLSHLGSSFLSMMDNAEVLRGTLALYEWTHSEMNRRRLEAITEVKHSETERFEQGYLVRGVQIEVTLDSHGFAGRGDICLFGEMLSRFFALYTDIYLFNRLIIILQPTRERLEWQEKHNRRIPG
ncbi:type VI secretion system baseplate subunit TssF [Pantoea vagans]|uniref:type VI secretion system baseplate subunit TssF n=1 Tax=Pantoea vagans TaxID=470934 RepID=UPI00396475A6